MQVDSLYIDILLRTAKMAREMANVTAEGKAWAQRYGSAVSRVITNALKVGLIGIVGALTVLGTSAVKSAASLEAQMSGVKAVLGATEEEAAALKRQVSDLAMDPGLKVNATEAAAAVEMLARNGLDADQILGGAARGVVLLSNATGGDFSKSADIATDAMAQFKIEVKDFEKVADGVTGVVNNSKFTIDDYGLALAQAGGVAATVGVEFDDFNTSIAAISPLFASGSDAGTSFKTFLQRLVPASGPAADAMQELGLLTEEGANQFFTASGELKSMAEVSQILNEALSGLSEEQTNQALSTIFGTDAMRAAAGMAGLTEEQFNALSEAINVNTSAAENAAERVNNLSGDWEIFQSVVEGLKNQLGDFLIPYFRQLVQAGTDLLSTYGPRMIAFFGNILTVFQNLVDDPSLDTFIESLGLLGVPQSTQDSLYAVAEAVEKLVSGIQNGDPVGAIREFMEAFNLPAGVESRISAALDAIQAFIDGFESGGVTQGIADFMESLNVPENVQGAINTVADGIGNAATAVADFVATNPEVVVDFLKGMGAALAIIVGAGFLISFVAGLFSMITPLGIVVVLAGALFSLWNNNIGGFQDKSLEAFETVKEKIDSFLTAIQPFIDAITNAIGPALQEFKDTVVKEFGVLADFLEENGIKWEGFGQFVGAVFVVMLGIISGVVSGVLGFLTGLVSGIALAIRGVINIFNGASEFIRLWLDSLVALFQGDWDRIIQNTLKMSGAMLTVLGGLLQIALGIFGGLLSGALNLIKQLWDGVVGYFTTLYNELVGNSIIPDMVDDILKVITDLKDGFLERIETLITDSIQAFKDKVSDFIDVGRNLILGVKEGISEKAGEIVAEAVQAAQNAVEAVKSWLGINSPSLLMAQEVGAPISQGVAKGIKDNEPLVDSAFESMIAKLSPDSNRGNTTNNYIYNGSENVEAQRWLSTQQQLSRLKAVGT